MKSLYGEFFFCFLHIEEEEFLVIDPTGLSVIERNYRSVDCEEILSWNNKILVAAGATIHIWEGHEEILE